MILGDSYIHLIVLTKMNCCLKSGIQQYAPNSRVHVQVLHWVRGLSFVDFLPIEKTASVRGTVAGEMCRLCGHSFLSALGFPEFSDLLDAPGFRYPHPLILLLLRQVSPLLCPSTRQGMHLTASLEYSTLRRISNFFSSCFQVSLQLWVFPGFLDAIGIFGIEELARTCEDRFTAADVDFTTILSSPFSSCILFAIVVGQLIKLDF